MDTPYYEVSGQVSDVTVVNDGKNANVMIDTGDENKEFQMRKFAFSQLLKFADFRKADLKSDGQILPDAGHQIFEALEDQDLRFKVGQENDKVIATVSPRYASINSEELENIVRETITSMGVSDFDHRVERTGMVTEQYFEFNDETAELEEVGDQLNAGLFVRNSVFGASSLRIQRYYTVLACSNGMVSQQSQSSFRKVHMGDAEDLREQIVEEVEMQIENIWEDTDLIQHVATIEFPISEQIELVEKLAEEKKITKKAAGHIAQKIIDESDSDVEDFEIEQFSLPDEEYDGDQTWNTGREDVWGLLNAFTGYAQHSETISQSALTDIQRVYNNMLEAENKNDVKAIAE